MNTAASPTPTPRDAGTDVLKHTVSQSMVMGEFRQNCTCGWRCTRKHIDTAIKAIGRHLDKVRAIEDRAEAGEGS